MKLRSIVSASVATLALFAANPAFADAHMEAAGETALPSGPEGPALWKVADEDTTIYLFGTVHALKPDVQWYDAEIDAALQSADTVVTEIKMDPESEAAMQQMALQRGMFTDGTTLRSVLDEEQTAKYEAALAGMGIPAATFDPFEPWMAGLTLTMLPLLQKGYDPNSGVDKIILGKSGDTAKDALETVEFQLGIFDGMPMDQQVEFMISAAEGAGEAEAMLDKMVAEWVEGDAEGLAAVMNENMEGEGFAEVLLYNRNVNWAEWIESRLETTPGTVFIAVGAGHLAGERSVQDYLAERGIETTRVQ
ncbi:MAG: TraB/GumN family protein [Erythrobacter sp.]|uniref:TraB/GumN family protein n=1 Tax=Erythrobacter sp. TaxID=1042 RepID=UPI003A8B1E62